MSDTNDFVIRDGVLVKYVGSGTSVTVPEGIEYIDDRAFEGAATLERVFLPESLAEMGDRVFLRCESLCEVTFPESPLKLGEAIFAFCPRLEKIVIGSKRGAYTSIFGCLIHKRTKTLIGACRTCRIPDNGIVTSIAPFAFEGSRELSCITLPQCLTYIGEGAFAACSSLTDIVIPDGVRVIGKRAFDGCARLLTVKLPRSLVRLYGMTFHGCAIKKITVPASVCEIEGNPFAACGALRSIGVEKGNEAFCVKNGCLIRICDSTVICASIGASVPANTLRIGELAFSALPLCGITLPEGLEYIGSGAFSMCKRLTAITVPSSVIEIASGAFADCETLERLTIEGDPKLNSGILDGSEGAVIVAPKMSIKRLRGYESAAVKGMCALYGTSEQYGKRIISGYALYVQRNRTSFAPICEKDLRYLKFALSEKAFDSNIANALLESASESGDTERISMLMEYLSSLHTEDGGDDISDDLGLSMDSLFAPKTTAELKKEWRYEKKSDGTLRLVLYTGKDKDVEIPSHIGKLMVTEIGENALSGYDELLAVSIPDSVTHIGRRAFYGCKGLVTLSLGRGLRRIGESAFYGCDRLSALELCEGLCEIDSRAFGNCGSLREVTLPSSLLSLGDCVFCACRALVSLSVKKENGRYFSSGGCIIEKDSGTLVAAASAASIPSDGSVRNIGQGFMYNTVIRELIIPDTVETIECNAFEGCVSLETVSLPKGLCELPGFTFSGCVSLRTVYAGGGISEVGLFPFDGCKDVVLYAPRGSVTASNAELFEVEVTEI